MLDRLDTPAGLMQSFESLLDGPVDSPVTALALLNPEANVWTPNRSILESAPVDLESQDSCLVGPSNSGGQYLDVSPRTPRPKKSSRRRGALAPGMMSCSSLESIGKIAADHYALPHYGVGLVETDEMGHEGDCEM